MVIGVDRGRWSCALDSNPNNIITGMRARELNKTPLVVGDHVDIVGDISGGKGTLARIVRIHERKNALRRTADDIDPHERIIAANTDQLIIVTSLSDPEPRVNFVQRALIAAYAAGITPVLALTKNDLAPHSLFSQCFNELNLPILYAGSHDALCDLQQALHNKISTFVGHSGVGKSTLFNRLIPEAHRTTAHVSAIGKGRHTSTQSVALPLPGGGWLIDTPGVRSFGLAHVNPSDIINAFEDLATASQHCPRGCHHQGAPFDSDCHLDTLTQESALRVKVIRELFQSISTQHNK